MEQKINMLLEKNMELTNIMKFITDIGSTVNSFRNFSKCLTPTGFHNFPLLYYLYKLSYYYIIFLLYFFLSLCM